MFTIEHLQAYGREAKREAATTIATLRAEVEGLRADAERYRWVRDYHIGDDPLSINLAPAKKRGLDAAIDAAKADKEGA